MKKPPKVAVIVGSGAFGLSTARALSQNPFFEDTVIKVVDHGIDESHFPPTDAASMDSSRIVRADYADRLTASLAAEAQREWRKQGDRELGGQGRYTESGFVLMADENPSRPPSVGKKSGMDYVKDSWQNVVQLAQEGGLEGGKIQKLGSGEALREQIGTERIPGDWGYLNGLSGWADAEAGMKWLYQKVKREGRVQFVNGEVAQLATQGNRVVGAELVSGEIIKGDLVIVAAGAWSGTLVDLRGRCEATAHGLAYMELEEQEAAIMRKQPVVLNLTSGLFVIPPKERQLKIARHSFGYHNPQTISKALPPRPEDPMRPFIASRPWTARDGAGNGFPKDADVSFREALGRLVPLRELASRPWTATRLCWYSDTRDGDWLVDWHPGWEGLFVATGDSGHGYKFLPVLGDQVVQCLLGNRDALREKWRWKDLEDDSIGRETNGVYHGLITEDGSRSGQPGVVLQNELRKDKSRQSHL